MQKSNKLKIEDIQGVKKHAISNELTTLKKFEKTIWRCILIVFLNLREVLTINLTIGYCIIFFSIEMNINPLSYLH